MKRMMLLLMLLLVGCGNDEETVQALKKAGYTHIQSTGWRPFVCAEDDTWSTGFVAIDASGHRVEGVVCCGLIMKACTIRF